MSIGWCHQEGGARCGRPEVAIAIRRSPCPVEGLPDEFGGLDDHEARRDQITGIYWFSGLPLMTTRSDAAGSPSSSSRVTQIAG